MWAIYMYTELIGTAQRPGNKWVLARPRKHADVIATLEGWEYSSRSPKFYSKKSLYRAYRKQDVDAEMRGR